MPKTGEVVIPIGDYGNKDEDDENNDHSLLLSFLEEIFFYEIETENLSVLIFPDDYGVTINLVKDFNPNDY